MTGEAPKINPKFNSEIIKNRLLDNSIPVTESGCWIWLKGIQRFGYGAISINRKQKPAHRISYQIFKGEIFNNLFVLHSCDTSACINPHHLFLGTQKDNIQDCIKKGRKKTNGNNLKTHCPRGHEYNEENTYYHDKSNSRHCRICYRQLYHERYREKHNLAAKQRYQKRKIINEDTLL